MCIKRRKGLVRVTAFFFFWRMDWLATFSSLCNAMGVGHTTDPCLEHGLLWDRSGSPPKEILLVRRLGQPWPHEPRWMIRVYRFGGTSTAFVSGVNGVNLTSLSPTTFLLLDAIRFYCICCPVIQTQIPINSGKKGSVWVVRFTSWVGRGDVMGKNKKETEPTITSTITKWRPDVWVLLFWWGMVSRVQHSARWHWLAIHVTSMSVQDGRANQKNITEIRQVSPRLT